MSLSTAFGDILRKHRKANELSQEKLAFDVDVTPNFIWMLENGKHVPNLELVFKIAHRFGISASELISEVEQENNH